MEAVEDGFIEAVGEWTDPPAPNCIPVTEEQYIANVRSALRRDLPNVVRQPDHDKVMVMVCGGPSAKLYLEDIRVKSKDDRYHIFCSNKTHDWLISEGIIPHTHFVIDPKPEKVKDVLNPRKDVRYLIGIGCVPEVFDALKGYNVQRLFCVGGVGKSVGNRLSDFQIANAFYAEDEFTAVEGGSMAGLRAMTIANVLGYQTVEFYGFDSCYFDTDDNGEPIYYSYDKKRKENIMEAQTESGKVYLTTPVFASQARQFIKWKHRLLWINFIIHGESLTHEINSIDEEKLKLKGYRISPYMLKLVKDLHRMESFGNGEDTDIGMVQHAGMMAVLCGQLLRKQDVITILDYGCGKGAFKKMFPPVENVYVEQYDPCIDEHSADPNPTDIVVCLDVLEHIEPECLHDVMTHLRDLTKQICYVSINTKPALKYLSDGQNAHLIAENNEWWTPILRKYFDIVESNVTKTHFNVVLQKKGLVCQ